MNRQDVFELYSDYLITSFSYTTATGLSDVLDNWKSSIKVLSQILVWQNHQQRP